MKTYPKHFSSVIVDNIWDLGRTCLKSYCILSELIGFAVGLKNRLTVLLFESYAE